MRRYVVAIVSSVLVMALGIAPGTAVAKKRKPYRESFTARALPFPNDQATTTTDEPGCLAGVDGVHRAHHDFVAPGNGVLIATMKGFTGDWDLFLTDPAGTLIVGSTRRQLDGAPAEEQVIYPLRKRQRMVLQPCNWLGAPEVTVDIEFVFQRLRSL